MSGEWTKQTIIDLITVYKEQENLYNPKHKLYYNKMARSKSLDTILKSVLKTKEDATVNDVVKKLQVLRTQFGQEINKIERSKSLGEELTYVPKIWWFKMLSFIATYMKLRSDPTTPLSVKLEQDKGSQETKGEEEETLFEIVGNMDEEMSDNDSVKKTKKRRIEFSPNIINSTYNQNSQHPTTIEYIINEEPSELIPNDQPSSVNASDSESKTVYYKNFKRKSKAFGNYVGVLLSELNDDKLFFEAQNEILKVIEKTALKIVHNKN